MAIWVGTEHGVNRIVEATVTAFGRQHGLPAELFQAIWAEPDGTVWLGSTDGGLVRWRHGRFAVVTTRQGLVGNENAAACVVPPHSLPWSNPLHRA